MSSASPAASFAVPAGASQRVPEPKEPDHRVELEPQAVSFGYRGHTVTPIVGTTSCGQPKVRIAGPIVNATKARENARLCIDGFVDQAERNAIRAGLPPVVSEASRLAALAAWGKRRHAPDPVLSAAWTAAFGTGAA